MIARIWTTEIDEALASGYETFAREKSLPMFRSQPGYCGVFMLRRGGACIVLSLWRDIVSIQTLAQSETYIQTVKEIMEGGFLQDGQSLETFDVHLADQADPCGFAASVPPTGSPQA